MHFRDVGMTFVIFLCACPVDLSVPTVCELHL